MRSGRWARDVRAQLAARLVQAGLGRAGRPADLPGGQVGVVVQLDGAPLAVRQIRDRGASASARSRSSADGSPAPRPGGDPRATRPAASAERCRAAARVHVADDASQPGAEPVRVRAAGPGHERLQERLLHDVVHVIGMPAQPRRAALADGECRSTSSRNAAASPDAGPPDQIAVADVHTDRSGRTSPGLPSTRPCRNGLADAGYAHDSLAVAQRQVHGMLQVRRGRVDQARRTSSSAAEEAGGELAVVCRPRRPGE